MFLFLYQQAAELELWKMPKCYFENGADKVVLNTSIYRDQVLVKSIVKR